MLRHQTHFLRNRSGVFRIVATVLLTTLPLGSFTLAVELPPETPLWGPSGPPEASRHEVEEQVRSVKPRPDAPSGLNRAFSAVSVPRYSIHRPEKPNGVGLVICPGGGFRDVWIDREGHDLAIRLKEFGVTSLVLKYRTFVAADQRPENTRENYQTLVQADGWQAIRVLRQKASELGLDPSKIGICGFSAGGHLAISCSLREPILPETDVSCRPDFAGLFYPGIPDDLGQLLERCATDGRQGPGICPMFIVNARDDRVTPAEKCVDFYAMLLKAEVNAELHVFGKGSHGFDLGTGRGESATLWPASFVAWLKDSGFIAKKPVGTDHDD